LPFPCFSFSLFAIINGAIRWSAAFSLVLAQFADNWGGNIVAMSRLPGSSFQFPGCRLQVPAPGNPCSHFPCAFDFPRIWSPHDRLALALRRIFGGMPRLTTSINDCRVRVISAFRSLNPPYRPFWPSCSADRLPKMKRNTRILRFWHTLSDILVCTTGGNLILLPQSEMKK